ncbi:MAG: phosphonate ABC transporter, permease protein PhnE [Janthinobacterium lividum]
MNASRPPLPDRPASCLRCRAALLAVIALVVASFVYLDMGFGALFSAESMRFMGRFVADFFPPDLSPDFLRKVCFGASQTLAVSALGTLLAAIVGAVLALPTSGRCGTTARRVARFALNFLRSVPELVWAAVMVLAAGIGPFAGALALALHTTGVLGRLFGETLENAPREPEHALTLSGAGPVAAFCYASLPIALPQWVAYTLYRWEMNIRMAAVLGFVGGGGLGQLLYFHLSIFQQQQAMTVLAGMFVLVAAVDLASGRLRRRLGSAYA